MDKLNQRMKFYEKRKWIYIKADQKLLIAPMATQLISIWN